MVIRIDYKFTPLRLVLSRKEPVQMAIHVTNAGTEPEKISLKVVVSRELGLDKTGIKNAALERVDALAPEETKTFYYEVSGKHSTEPGHHPIKISVEEHYRDYSFKKQEYVIDAEIRVEE